MCTSAFFLLWKEKITIGCTKDRWTIKTVRFCFKTFSFTCTANLDLFSTSNMMTIIDNCPPPINYQKLTPLHSSICLNFFHLLAWKPKLEIFSNLFKEILSWNSLVWIQFYLSWASGNWVSAKTDKGSLICMCTEFFLIFAPKVSL